MTAWGVENLWLFVLAGIALNLTPGPDVIYVVTNGLKSGGRAGLAAAAGITAGCFVHICAGALGVSALIAASATAFALLQWAGAAYLVFLGVRMLRPRSLSVAPVLIADDAQSTRARGVFSLKTVFIRGFVTNALNPKVALFFLAFVPQFIGAQAPHPTLAFLALGLVFNINGFFVNAGYGLLAAWAARRVTAVQRGLRLLERVAGALFMGFGVKLALGAR